MRDDDSLEDRVLCRFYVVGNIKVYSVFQVEYPILLSDLNQISNFTTDFYESLKYQIFMEIRPVEPEPIYVGMNTGMTKPIGAFR